MIPKNIGKKGINLDFLNRRNNLSDTNKIILILICLSAPWNFFFQRNYANPENGLLNFYF